MNELIYIELKELKSLLAEVSNNNLFSVPAGYFETLAADIVLLLDEPVLLNKVNIPRFDMYVPKGYFDELAENILEKIKEDEPVLSPVLSSLRDQNPFKVPGGYFESVPDKTVLHVSKESARLVAMKPRPAIWRYAVAAAVTGILGLSLFSMFNKKDEPVKRLYPSAVITRPDTAKLLLSSAVEILKNNSFDKEMEALDEDVIISYLKNDEEDINAALVAAATDERILPGEDDYLTDEKALDNFLDEQHILKTGTN